MIIICSFLPAIIDMNNNKTNIFNVFAFSIIVITMLFILFIHISLLFKDRDKCYCCCLNTNYIFGGVSVSHSSIFHRLFVISVVFIAIWIIPGYFNYIQFAHGNTTNIALIAVNNYAISSIGLCNCLIWAKSKNFKSVFSSYHEMVEMENENRKNSVCYQNFNI